jgi:hypothetical protein
MYLVWAGTSMVKLFSVIVFVLSLPLWVPAVIIALRMYVFTAINAEHGIELPNKDVSDKEFKAVYNHPAVSGRSEGAGLSDLFWYFLAPCPELHQEHIENGPLYVATSLATKKLLAASTERIVELAEKHTKELFNGKLGEPGSWTVERLREFWFPMYTALFHELIFDQDATPEGLDICIKSGENIINALKFSTFRDMKARYACTRYIMEMLQDPHVQEHLEGVFDEALTPLECAATLQGVFFHTGCVQLAEGMAHTMLALAQHADVEQKVYSGALDGSKEGASYLKLVVTEVFRCWPLFGVAHRITSEDITVSNGKTYPKGTVFTFNYPKYQATGFERPDEFIPERWLNQSRSASNYIPFGVKGNRPCPAQRFALIMTRACTSQAVRMASFHSSAQHTRSLPCLGPCLIVKREAMVVPEGAEPMSIVPPAPAVSKMFITSTLQALRVRDVWEHLTRSVTQFVVGAYMLQEHKKLVLTKTFFASGKAERYYDLNQPGIGEIPAGY